jgi:hypothetical protein
MCRLTAKYSNFSYTSFLNPNLANNRSMIGLWWVGKANCYSLDASRGWTLLKIFLCKPFNLNFEIRSAGLHPADVVALAALYLRDDHGWGGFGRHCGRCIGLIVVIRRCITHVSPFSSDANFGLHSSRQSCSPHVSVNVGNRSAKGTVDDIPAENEQCHATSP